MTALSLEGGGGWPIFGPNLRGRSCGSCQACCTNVPVERPLNKPAGVRCQHLRAKGCGIYATRPDVCQYWSCAWLYQQAAKDLKRPDHCGYIVDPMPQEIMIGEKPASVIQIWVDPLRPEAHRAPELRQYLTEMARQFGLFALVRWSHAQGQAGSDALFLAAPCMTDDGEWHERVQPMVTEERMAELRAAAANG